MRPGQRRVLRRRCQALSHSARGRRRGRRGPGALPRHLPSLPRRRRRLRRPGRRPAMTADASDVDRRAAGRFRDLLRSERQSAALYRGLAAGTDGERREIFMELAAAEERHAAHWAAKLTALGETVPESGGLSARTRLLSWLARRFSTDTVLPLVERAEHSDAGLYDGDPHAAPEMAADE